MYCRSQKTCIFIIFLVSRVTLACIPTISVSPAVTTTTTSTTSSTITTTTTPTTTTTTSTITTTPTTTSTTTSTTTTTTTGSCSSCMMNLMQGMIIDPTGINGMATITYTMAGGCIIANIVCTSVMGNYVITIALQENEGLLFGGGCGAAAMPPGIVACNAMGQWISTVTGSIQPVIICDQVDPADNMPCA